MSGPTKVAVEVADPLQICTWALVQKVVWSNCLLDDGYKGYGEGDFSEARKGSKVRDLFTGSILTHED